jgi:ABC-type phosphate transport system substrate-binding protein
MRARTVLTSAAALLVLALCASCGSGGGGGSAGDSEAAPDASSPASVALTWSGSDDVAGYVVHWGTTSGVYSRAIDVRKPVADAQGAVTIVITLDGVDADVAGYFFAITSYDTAGSSSAYSNELSIDATSTG